MAKSTMTFYQVWEALSDKARAAFDRELEMRVNERTAGQLRHHARSAFPFSPVLNPTPKPWMGSTGPDGVPRYYATREEAIACRKAAGEYVAPQGDDE